MKIGIVSTFNVECGISTYSEHLTTFYPMGETHIFANNLSTLSDTRRNLYHPITRCWHRQDDFKELTQKILDEMIDVVHIQHEFGLFQNDENFKEMLMTLKSNGVKIVITFHTIFADSNHIKNMVIRQWLPFIDKVIVHQQGAKDALKSDKCVVIPHGSVSVYKQEREIARKYLNIPEDKIVLMFLGFISPNKGQIDATIAVSHLRLEFPNIYLVIAGLPVINGCHFENLEYCLNLFRSVKRMGGFEYTRIIPNFIYEDDFDYYFGAGDIFIENHGHTQYSTSGIAHLIMSYGVPSVSSNAYILNDLNEDRSVKFKVGDTKGMEDALRSLIVDKELRNKVAKNAHEYYRETKWPNIANRHLRLYDEII